MTPYRRAPSPASRARRVLLVPPALLVLAACASTPAASPAPGTAAPAAPSATASTTASPPPTTAPPASDPTVSAGPAPATSAGPQRCTAAALTGRLRAGDAGAGQRSATLVLTNRGGRACRLDGYGGVQLADAAGRDLPTRQVRDPATGPRPVVLAPGAAGSSLLRWTVVPGAGDRQSGPCQPAPASLRVIPPDQRTALSVPWSLGPVCAGGRIVQAAYRPA